MSRAQCTVPDCSRTNHGKGLCQPHLHQYRQHGWHHEHARTIRNTEILSDFTGAPCTDNPPDWDAGKWWEHHKHAQRRQEAAARTCVDLCPHIVQCRRLLAAEGRTATGVWAGRVLDPVRI